MSGDTLQCARCRDTLVRASKHQKFCSDRCKTAFYRSQQPKPSDDGHICRICGNSFVLGPGQNNKWICSNECRRKRPRKKCPHGSMKYRCRDCGGVGLCVHGRQKHFCKECGGKWICEHGKKRNVCKACGGTSVCEHGRVRYTCKKCGGSGVCEHQRERGRCKQCGGAGAIARNLCTKAKNRAKVQNIPFSLRSSDVLAKLSTMRCPVFGTPFSLTGSELSSCASLDKRIPSLGYVKENIEVISHRANIIKQDASTFDVLRLGIWMHACENGIPTTPESIEADAKTVQEFLKYRALKAAA